MMKQDFQPLGRWLYEFMSRGYQNDGSKTKSMQATMFMLDSTGVWNSKYKNSYADYAIGGPTSELLEQLLYNKIRKSSLYLPVDNNTGYGRNSYSAVEGSRIIPWHDECFILATPRSTRWYGDMFVWNKDRYTDCRVEDEIGFRPVVRINSKYKLITSDGGNTYKLSN